MANSFQRFSRTSFLPAAAGLLFTVLANSSQVGDWPRLRGADGSNVSGETGWSSEGREGVLWQREIGRGYSSPVISDGRLFTTGYFEAEAQVGSGFDRVHCFDVRSGEVLWHVDYPALAYANEHEGGTLSTPTVAAGVVFVPTRKGEVRAFDASSGAILWSVDLVERHAVEPGRYGFASSPCLVGDALVLNAGRTILLERSTGETLWISEDFKANFSTVAPIQLGEQQGLVVFGEEGLIVIDASTGAELRAFDFRKAPRNVEGAMPIVMGSRVFISSAYDQGGAMVEFASETPTLLWRTRRMRSKMDGCTLYKDHLYGFDESMLTCMDLAGKVQWRERGLGHGALSICGDRLLTTTSRGELIVAEASPAGYNELSRRQVLDEGVFWTSPVLSNGHVFYRGSRGTLVALDYTSDGIDPSSGGRAGAGSIAAVLPSPAQLGQRYLEACNWIEKPIGDLRLKGRLHNDALGLVDRPASFAVGQDNRWHCTFELPPDFHGSLSYCFDGKRGWKLDPFRGDELMEQRKVQELKDTHGNRLWLNPLPKGAPAETIGLEEFRGQSCYRVDVKLDEKRTRHLFFDAQTGLLAGRTAAFEDTVVLGDWRQLEGRKIPMLRVVFDAETGEEQRWVFREASLEPLEDELFSFPPELEQEPGGADEGN